MPKYLTIALLLVALATLAGCAGPGSVVEAGLGQETVLAIGQTLSISEEQLQVKFVEVVADSRCPANVLCPWQGEVSCLTKVTYRGAAQDMVLTQPGLSQGPGRATFADYEIQFNVQPYPEAGKTIQNKDYRLALTVDKRPALSGGVLATFDVVGERYSIFITNKQTIEQVFALQRRESKATIPSGRVVRGAVPYNQPWSWHIDPEDVGMAEVTIELCDGLPSHVEADLDYWVDTVKAFCPWSARLVDLKDYR